MSVIAGRLCGFYYEWVPNCLYIIIQEQPQQQQQPRSIDSQLRAIEMMSMTLFGAAQITEIRGLFKYTPAAAVADLERANNHSDVDVAQQSPSS